MSTKKKRLPSAISRAILEEFYSRKDLAKKFKEHGATIIGGCCETRPSHIEAMAKIK